jgi:hypothetical protein
MLSPSGADGSARGAISRATLAGRLLGGAAAAALLAGGAFLFASSRTLLTGEGSRGRNRSSATFSALAQKARKTAGEKKPIELDRYGGLLPVSSRGGGTGYFRVEKRGDRWLFVTPSGHPFWMFGVYDVNPEADRDDRGSSYRRRVIRKYGDADLSWGPQQNRRLLVWGFNTLGLYSSIYTLPIHSEDRWPRHQQPVKMPFLLVVRPALYSLRNLNHWASGSVKDIVAGTDSHYRGWRSSFPDVFDPNFSQWLSHALAKDPVLAEARRSPFLSYLVGVVTDDLDNLNGFGAGPAFRSDPPGHTNRNIAWVTLVTSPTQKENARLGLTYSDPKVFTKYALRDFLAAKYGTIAALNRAWGSDYTTFGSDGGWPAGNGLLDEDGRHRWVGTDSVRLDDAPPAVKIDMNAFLLELAKRYFSVCRALVKHYFPHQLYFGVDTIGSWRTPAAQPVLEAAGEYVDVMVTNASRNPEQLNFETRWLGDKPILVWEGGQANPDSDLWHYRKDASDPLHFQTQAGRGKFLAGEIRRLFRLSAGGSGVKPVVGICLWQYTDNWPERANWGLVSLSDNAYDGREAEVAPGKDRWGYATGGEERNYGDALTPILKAIQEVKQALLSEREPH